MFVAVDLLIKSSEVVNGEIVYTFEVIPAKHQIGSLFDVNTTAASGEIKMTLARQVHLGPGDVMFGTVRGK